MTRALLALALLAAAASAAAPRASAQTARLHVLADSVSVGERVGVAVAVDHGPGVSARFPAVPAGDPEAGPLLTLGDVEAFAVRRLPPIERGALRTDSAVYEVAAFAVDSARVGPVAVTLAGGADTTTATAPAVWVPVRPEVEGPPPHTPSPVGPPDDFPSPVALWVGLGAAGLLVLGGAAWGLARWRRRPSAAAPRAAPYPEVLEHLAALDAETPGTPAEVEAHVVAVRAAVRGYLARRLGVAAREVTTDELDAALRADRRLDAAAAEAVHAALRPTDLVAFAGVRPASEVVARIRASGRAAVEAVEAAVRAHEAREAARAAGDGQSSPPPVPQPPPS